MSYQDLFKRAAGLWWRTRALWPLGLLAALFGYGDYTTGGNFNFNFSSGDTASIPPGVIERWLENPLVRSFAENPETYVIGFVLALAAWALVAALVGQLAHGAMIALADRADDGVPMGLGDALGVGVERLLPMFLLALLMGLPTILLIIAGLAVAIPVIASLIVMAQSGGSADPSGVLLGLGGALLCLVPLGLVVWGVSIALTFFGRMAQRVCVIEQLGAIASLRRSWPLVTRNFGLTLLGWLTTLMLGVVYGLATTLPALAIVVPAFMSAMSSGQVPWGALVALIVYSVVATALLGGWLTSFNSALWTVLYRAFRAREREFAVPASYAPGD